MTKRFRIAILGRPNVGKSTFFNKVVGKQMAIVDDRPGVTRDFREEHCTIQGKAVTLIDTAGLEDHFDDSMLGRMRKQTERALDSADMILFMIDGREGVTALDSHFAQWVRKQNKPKLLLINKCESRRGDLGIAEGYGLGLGTPYPISAEHVDGFFNVFQAIIAAMPDENAYTEADNDQNEQAYASLDDIEGDEDFEFTDQNAEQADLTVKPLKMAIIGRPNVGKSTLVNALLNEERVMTGPEAGVTRDAIAVDWEYQGKKFKLVDTAGMRRKSKVVDPIERLSVEDSQRAIRLAQIVVLVIDAELGIDKQDLMIAAHALEEGRGLILAVNKWDQIQDKNTALDQIKYRLETSLSQVKYLPIQPISALESKNLDKLMDKVLWLYDLWNSRVSTGKINRWLDWLTSKHPPPLVKGRENRLRYITQINTRPPTFALWLSSPKGLPDSYQRYIINALREDFDLPGTPVRLLLRKSKNPYIK